MGFTGVVFGVQDFVANSALGKKLGKVLALFNRVSSNQHWLLGFVASRNVFNNHRELDFFVLVDQVGLVFTNHLAVGWNWNYTQLVGAHEFGSFGFSGTGHTG